MKTATDFLAEQLSKSSFSSPETQPTVTIDTTTSNEQNVVDIKEEQDISTLLTDGIKMLENEMHRLDRDKQDQQDIVDRTGERLSKLKISVEETRTMYDANSTNLKVLQQDVACVKDTWNDQQVASFDGTIIWRIAKIKDVMCKIIQNIV